MDEPHKPNRKLLDEYSDNAQRHSEAFDKFICLMNAGGVGVSLAFIGGAQNVSPLIVLPLGIFVIGMLCAGRALYIGQHVYVELYLFEFSGSKEHESDGERLSNRRFALQQIAYAALVLGSVSGTILVAFYVFVASGTLGN